jgi:hypothetical protein
VTGYYGTVRITNSKATAVQVDSVRIELVNNWALAGSSTSAEAAANCSVGVVAPGNMLRIAAGASAECNYVLKAKVGGEVLATITTVDDLSTVASTPRPVQQLSSADAATSCAVLVTGLGATTLVPGG